VNVQKDRHGSDDSIEVRQRVEAALRRSGFDTDKLLSQQVRHLIHELEVFEVELEMQNEELHRDQEELEAARERYADLYDSTPIGYLTVSDKEQILEVNLTAARLLGMKRGVLLGQSLPRFIAPEYHDVYYKHFKAVLAAANVQTCEMRMVARDGSPFDVRMQSMGIANNDGTITKWRTVISDVTERKRITQELSRTLEQQNGLHLILRAIQVSQTPVQALEVAIDHVLQISCLGMQASAAAFLLRGQQLHKVVSRNLPPAVDQGCTQLALGQCLCGHVAQTREPIICAHGDEYATEDDERHHHAKSINGHGHVILPIKWQSQILGVLCFYVSAGEELDDHCRDFIETVAFILATAIGRLTYQSQLAQSERLSSVGLLAAGVAHEINNPLALALTNVEWLVEDLSPILEHSHILRQRVIDELGAERASTLLSDLADLGDDELLQDMAQCTKSALEGIRRVRTIVRDLGTFSRADEDQLSQVSLVDVLERALTLAYNEIKYRARLTRDFKQTPSVLANEGRLSQVFLNLLINAAHAIDKGDPEDNEIRVRLWREGKKVLVEVRDTGRGIAPADLPYLFEPFFTTKEKGVGTGLGLYISNNIVTSLGGHIDVESAVGRGTRFIVHLPVAKPLTSGSTAIPSD
jgi:PAS domain S-box-containing protein